ncbi:hypothetical protein [Nautilia lithotrophica]
MNYKEDRSFTEYVHKNIALEKIYNNLGWEKVNIDINAAELLDINKGIDRIFKTPQNDIVTVQERFRTKKYFYFNDFTIRYTREKNQNISRRKSEFFKIEADFFVYGITNCENNQSMRQCDDFLKFAVINMDIIKNMLDSNLIEIDKNLNKKVSEIRKGKIIAPVLTNHDGSSEFIALKIDQIYALNPNSIVLEKGFINE